MRVLVTGARGKVGRATVAALLERGHDVRATDIGAPVFERPVEGEADYFQADLTDAGDAFAVVRGAEAVVHAAAIPEPTRNPPHVVFQNNLMATFNALEAAIRFNVGRFVNLSSETVPGFFFPERPVLPDQPDVSVLADALLEARSTCRADIVAAVGTSQDVDEGVHDGRSPQRRSCSAVRGLILSHKRKQAPEEGSR